MNSSIGFGLLLQDFARSSPKCSPRKLYLLLSRAASTGPWCSPSSTCTALERPSAVVWDANRYYADLGVATSASRAQIRTAYLDGPGTARLTFLASQLLNREIRAAYDLTPLGFLPKPDSYNQPHPFHRVTR